MGTQRPSETTVKEAQQAAALHGVVHVLSQRARGGGGGLLDQLRHQHADDVAPLVHEGAAGIARRDGRTDLEMSRVILRPGQAGDLALGQRGREALQTDIRETDGGDGFAVHLPLPSSDEGRGRRGGGTTKADRL
jgi:hypothetical protein